jgi:heme/copper-type cytochrome/quinol oxidase subunit 3
MFDLEATRALAAQTHPPLIVFIMLGVLALTSSLLAGYAMASGKRQSWIHVVGFALIMATTFYVILDLEYPRLGIIRVDAFDRVLVNLRQNMQ